MQEDLYVVSSRTNHSNFVTPQPSCSSDNSNNQHAPNDVYVVPSPPSQSISITPQASCSSANRSKPIDHQKRNYDFEWSFDRILILISYVESNELFYVKSHDDFKNTTKRLNKMKVIAEKLQTTALECNLDTGESKVFK